MQRNRLLLPRLDILAVDADEALHGEWEAEDDVKGGPLDPHKVKTARQNEIQYLWDREVYEYSTEAEARALIGRNPFGLIWTDTNKGSAEVPRYRSRLVFTEVHHQGVEPIFSAPPPLETLRVLLCFACQEDVFRVEDPFLISIADVSRAHMYAYAVRDVYVRLPDEDQGKVASCVWEIAKDNVRISGCSPTVRRALRSSFGDWKIFPRRVVSVPFVHKLAELHSGARR